MIMVTYPIQTKFRVHLLYILFLINFSVNADVSLTLLASYPAPVQISLYPNSLHFADDHVITFNGLILRS